MNDKNHILKPIKPMIIGKIGSAYSIRGYFRIYSFTEKIESIFNYLPWFVKINGTWHNLNLETWRHHNKKLIVKAKYIDSRSAAESLINCDIIIENLQLPKLDNDEYYWKDLLNCHVITISGYDLGKVIDLIETGSNDVLVVQSNSKDHFNIKERLIPFLKIKVIKDIDLINRIIKVDWSPVF